MIFHSMVFCILMQFAGATPIPFTTINFTVPGLETKLNINHVMISFYPEPKGHDCISSTWIFKEKMNLEGKKKFCQ